MKKIYFLAPLFLLLFACSEDDVDPIEVPLTACFDVNKTTLNLGEEFQITSCSEGAASFSYSFGAGVTKTEPNPTFAYETAGEFTIKLTVTAADGRTDVAEKVVHVNSV